MNTSGAARKQGTKNPRRTSVKSLLETVILGGAASIAIASPSAAQETGILKLDTIEIQTSDGKGPRAPVEGYIAEHSRAATKSDVPIREVPQSISVVTRDNMNDRAVQSVSEAMLYSANVNAQRYGADVRSDYFTVRGFPADLYLDGLRIPQIASQSGGYSGFVVEPYSLESVEILRGPSSALFGQSNVGGIVNMVSKQPQAEASHEIYLRGGSFERKEFGADITGPINNDPRFTYRLNGIFRDSNTSYDLGKNDRIAINPSFAWRPDADTSLVVSGGYLKDDMGQAGVIIPAYGSVLPNPTGQTISRDFSDGDPRNAIYKKEIGYAGYDFEHRFNDTFTLRQNFRYSHMKTDYRNLFTGVIPTKGWDGHTIPRTNYLAQPELDAIAFDTQLESRFDTGPVAHTLLVGFDQQWQRLDNYTASASGPTQDLFNPTYGQPLAELSPTTRLLQKQYQTGIYVQDQIEAGKLRVTLGGRKDFVSIRSEQTALASRKTTDYEQDPDKFTGRVGVAYLFDSGLVPYALYSTSFLPTLTLADTPLKPTTGTLKEVGVKYAPEGEDYTVTLSAFEAEQQNVVNRISGVYYQTDEVRVRGIELEGTARLWDRLNLTAALSFQDPEVCESQNPDQIGKLPYTVPKNQQSVFLSYDMPLPGNIEGNLVVGGGVRRIGKTAGDTLNTFYVPSYTLVDAFLRYDIGSYRLQVNAFNLGDKKYVAGCNSTSQCYYGQGRSIVATTSVRW
ncbi:TonB-dependent siderophore receptor [Brucella intermedia]|uniref:Heme transporter BhuA n=1 Tax=Brucella intermedia TaxID=94625 RepID=A0A7V6PD72_9HYPH|nr:TonB-dependent siderophore receptor [Brucella intermedia]PJR93132.1 TonB-dependent siderophore receptor [Ochrobactrum sp. 721/2009]PJT15327.1 TonB-dependent siderophore receptor [Ochrobactrum sp. 720/2009]PJT23283.1 TonB-dependent siderophore receptor [Ochrobactrum sp. 715/2009]PJT25405.1 TonB-dependent siderophore receptor [Ochrobactrum sp. 695/2009]PJT32611.1 TonB-dependent siderophore receptor [Ochrobactrum sp. 689/2009]